MKVGEQGIVRMGEGWGVRDRGSWRPGHWEIALDDTYTAGIMPATRWDGEKIVLMPGHLEVQTEKECHDGSVHSIDVVVPLEALAEALRMSGYRVEREDKP